MNTATESRGFESDNPGRDVQRVGTARYLGEDVAKVHQPVWGVIGTLGDSQCYLGVQAKVAAVHAGAGVRVPRRRPARAVDRAGVHARRVRRPAQRDTRNALLADQP